MKGQVDPAFPNCIPAGIVVDETNLPVYAPNRVKAISLDRSGRVLVGGTISATLGTSVTISDAVAFASGSIVGSALMAYNGASFDRLRSGADNADGVAAAALGRLIITSRGSRFNGTTWDLERGNTEGTLLASAARTATTATADQTNHNARGGHIAVNVTVFGASTLTPTIQGRDPVSGAYYDILVGTPITATGLVIFKVHPSITAVAGAAAKDVLPRTWRVNCAKGDASAWTYSVGFALVV